jgi:hypothetical protein
VEAGQIKGGKAEARSHSAMDSISHESYDRACRATWRERRLVHMASGGTCSGIRNVQLLRRCSLDALSFLGCIKGGANPDFGGTQAIAITLYNSALSMHGIKSQCHRVTR